MSLQAIAGYGQTSLLLVVAVVILYGGPANRELQLYYDAKFTLFVVSITATSNITAGTGR